MRLMKNSVNKGKVVKLIAAIIGFKVEEQGLIGCLGNLITGG